MSQRLKKAFSVWLEGLLLNDQGKLSFTVLNTVGVTLSGVIIQASTLELGFTISDVVVGWAKIVAIFCGGGAVVGLRKALKNK